MRITDKNPIYLHEHQVLHVLHEYNRWKIDVECGWLNEQRSTSMMLGEDLVISLPLFDMHLYK